VCFVFNVGEGSYSRSTLLKFVNQKKFKDASEEFLRWVKGSDGKTLKGLVLRRIAEKNMFLRGAK
jgi:lysozyme